MLKMAVMRELFCVWKLYVGVIVLFVLKLNINNKVGKCYVESFNNTSVSFLGLCFFFM